jgi:predicted RNase H-like HicB family nuclease
MARPKRYNISDGKLLLTLEEAEKGWYVVSSPMEPGLNTQARTIPEAFEMAKDALRMLRKFRASRGRLPRVRASA